MLIVKLWATALVGIWARPPGEGRAMGAKVLVYYHPAARSHTAFMKAIARELEGAGHVTTALHTPFIRAAAGETPVSPGSSLTEWRGPWEGTEGLDGPASGPGGPWEGLKEFQRDLEEVLDRDLWAPSLALSQTYARVLGAAVGLASLCRVLDERPLAAAVAALGPDFVVLDETLFPCVFGVPRRLGVPFLQTVGVAFLVNQAAAQGVPHPPSYVTGPLAAFDPSAMGFRSRLLNWADGSLNLFLETFLHVLGASFMDPPGKFRTLSQMVTNVSMYLVNDDPVLLPPRPTTSSVVLVGGQFLDGTTASSRPGYGTEVIPRVSL